MDVSPLLVRCLHAFVARSGDATVEFLAALRETLALSGDPYFWRDVAYQARVARLASFVAQQPSLALRAGRDLSVRELGIPGLLVAEASTFRAALGEIARTLPLLCRRGRCALTIEAGIARFALAFDTDSLLAQRIACEFAFALLLQVVRSFGTPSATPNQLRFPYAAPGHVAEYAEYFDCELRFDDDRAEFCFPLDWLDLERPITDEILLRAVSAEAEVLLSRVARGTSMRERVYVTLMADPTLTESHANALAKQLNTSITKMRRALRNEGETLLAIADQVRLDRARSLLAHGRLTIRMISEQLGYSQPSAFHRAFKRQTGLSPLEYRRQSAAL